MCASGCLPSFLLLSSPASPAGREGYGPEVDQAVVGSPVPVGDSMADSVDSTDTEVR